MQTSAQGNRHNEQNPEEGRDRIAHTFGPQQTMIQLMIFWLYDGMKAFLETILQLLNLDLFPG